MKYQFVRPAAVNAEKLSDELKAQIPAVNGINTTPDAVFVLADELSAQDERTAESIIVNHDPSPTTAQQTEKNIQTASSQLSGNNAGRLKYLGYFVNLQNVSLGHIANRTIETTRFTETLAALKRNKASDPDDAFMFNTFLYEAGIEFNTTVTENALNNLPLAQHGEFYKQVRAFYSEGLLACLAVLMQSK